MIIHYFILQQSQYKFIRVQHMLQIRLSLIFYIFVVLSIIISINCQKPRLPVYVGIGYDILQGNPFESDGVDPGFKHTIFVNSYDKNQMTQDNSYLVPDGFVALKTTACSFYSEVNIFRGTKSYQKTLQKKAKASGNFLVKILKAAFSHSKSYKTIQNKTFSENRTFTHASAECESYQLSIDLFQLGPITPNFWKGVSYCFKNKDWSKFVSQFGTHFTYEVTMGGRATQQIQYDSRDISNLDNLHIDLKTAAKVSFASFFSFSGSYDKDKETIEANHVKLYSKNIRQIFIGGQPPRSGNPKQWQQNVRLDPMPIKYELLPLSELFKYHPENNFDFNGAVVSFSQYLDTYCNENNCKQPVQIQNQTVTNGIQPIQPVVPVPPVQTVKPIPKIRRPSYKNLNAQQYDDVMDLRRSRNGQMMTMIP